MAQDEMQQEGERATIETEQPRRGQVVLHVQCLPTRSRDGCRLQGTGEGWATRHCELEATRRNLAADYGSISVSVPIRSRCFVRRIQTVIAATLSAANKALSRRHFATFAGYSKLSRAGSFFFGAASPARSGEALPAEKVTVPYPRRAVLHMRIAQIAPLFEAVPPKLYGGTERVVYALTEELVAMGHDVTLFASGDSVTSAKLDAPWPQRAAPRSVGQGLGRRVYMRMMEYVYRRAHEFDVLHFHVDYFPSSLFSRQPTPFLTTLHGRLDLPEFGEIYNMFPDVPMVSISDSQRLPLPDLGWVAHRAARHSRRQLLTPQPVKQEYLAFLGRISPEKGIEAAIRIAGRAGIKLRVAAKVDNADREYFESAVEPLLKTNPHVEFIGEINDAQKPAFLSGAHALLFPIDWPEPFGLVMIESMACGCPVIAMRRGSVPEVMDDGVTGFIVDSEDEAVAALARVPTLDRAAVRERFELRWTARRMAQDYVDIYHHLAHASKPQLRAVGD